MDSYIPKSLIMKIRAHLIIFFLLLTTSSSYSQRILDVGVGTSLFLSAESGIYFVGTDFFVHPQFSLSGNIGVTDFEEIYYALGGNFHFNTRKGASRLTPYIGALIGREFESDMIQASAGLRYLFDSVSPFRVLSVECFILVPIPELF